MTTAAATKKRTILIGDIHGCFDELMALLKKINFNKEQDRLILLGDIINKGPKSVEVIFFAKENNIECIKGNHEQGFLDALNGLRSLTGGFKKLATELGPRLNLVKDWLESLPFYIEEKDFIAVHAGLAPRVALKNQSPDILTRIRTWDGAGVSLNSEEDPAWFELYKNKKLVVFGHWASMGLVNRENCIGLDTGCVWGGELSALVLPNKEVISVAAYETYLEV
jgi:diadenosine tetraphosphatase ApaH/serine/threonine PP2A family protein phosphatase